ncbi:hypothetical protein C7974DRAFT_417990 [Boeremia exigua]|uniref:uncharacterized protein n=1 Tax=Boeremia exigua TaxID=749465 RepID=UPI001E8C9DD4|nr:uncharacterized protein C7974DRAFT_417990 [Boeremia exigua]KAH6614273.1 hypothetical protein C7974DRAFT_417990 [Boeremia exigua]
MVTPLSLAEVKFLFSIGAHRWVFQTMITYVLQYPTWHSDETRRPLKGGFKVTNARIQESLPRQCAIKKKFEVLPDNGCPFMQLLKHWQVVFEEHGLEDMFTAPKTSARPDHRPAAPRAVAAALTEDTTPCAPACKGKHASDTPDSVHSYNTDLMFPDVVENNVEEVVHQTEDTIAAWHSFAAREGKPVVKHAAAGIADKVEAAVGSEIEDKPAVGSIEDKPAVGSIEDKPAVGSIEDKPAVGSIEDKP